MFTEVHTGFVEVDLLPFESEMKANAVRCREEGRTEGSSSFSVHGYLNYWISGIGLVAL